MEPGITVWKLNSFGSIEKIHIVNREGNQFELLFYQLANWWRVICIKLIEINICLPFVKSFFSRVARSIVVFKTPWKQIRKMHSLRVNYALFFNLFFTIMAFCSANYSDHFHHIVSNMSNCHSMNACLFFKLLLENPNSFSELNKIGKWKSFWCARSIWFHNLSGSPTHRWASATR